jgi:hypothetical protein
LQLLPGIWQQLPSVKRERKGQKIYKKRNKRQNKISSLQTY